MNDNSLTSLLTDAMENYSDDLVRIILKLMLEEATEAIQDKPLYDPAVADFIRMFAKERGIKI